MTTKNSVYENFYTKSDFHRVLFFNKIKITSIMEHANLQDEWLLDIGCGTGDDTHILSKFANNCVGLDFSKKGLKQAKTKYPDLYLVCGDALNPPFKPNFYDSVFSSNISTFNTWDQNEISAQLIKMWGLVKDNGLLMVLYSSFLLGKNGINSKWKDLRISDFEGSLEIGNIKDLSKVFYVNPFFFILFRDHSFNLFLSKASSFFASIFKYLHIPGYIVIFSRGLTKK